MTTETIRKYQPLDAEVRGVGVADCQDLECDCAGEDHHAKAAHSVNGPKTQNIANDPPLVQQYENVILDHFIDVSIDLIAERGRP